MMEITIIRNVQSNQGPVTGTRTMVMKKNCDGRKFNCIAEYEYVQNG